MSTSTHDNMQKMIAAIYKIIENLGGSQEVLAILGSWDDSLTPAECIEMLELYNETDTCIQELICSVHDTPEDRRKRFKLLD